MYAILINEFDETGKRQVICKSIYKHFKGRNYFVENIGEDTETGKEYVIYRDINTNKIWIREKSMFLSEVDHEKYPDVKQKYRFEYVGTDENYFNRY